MHGGRRGKERHVGGVVCLIVEDWKDTWMKDYGCRLSSAEKSLSFSFRCPRWSGCRDASDGHRGPGVVFLPYTIIVPCATSTEATDSDSEPEPSFVGSTSPECCFGGDYLLRKLQRKILYLINGR
ncbi:hypothetical protein Tco_0847036, partial [Tanacetum coccineum]